MSDICKRWTWKLTLQTPQATVHSSEVAEAWLAWHSIPDVGRETCQQMEKKKKKKNRSVIHFTVKIQADDKLSEKYE